MTVRTPSLAVATPQVTAIMHESQASRNWGDEMHNGSAEITLLLKDLFEGEQCDEKAEGDTNTDILDMDEMEEDPTFSVHQSRPTSASDAATTMDGNLYKVCKVWGQNGQQPRV